MPRPGSAVSDRNSGLVPLLVALRVSFTTGSPPICGEVCACADDAASAGFAGPAGLVVLQPAIRATAPAIAAAAIPVRIRIVSISPAYAVISNNSRSSPLYAAVASGIASTIC